MLNVLNYRKGCALSLPIKAAMLFGVIPSHRKSASLPSQPKKISSCEELSGSSQYVTLHLFNDKFCLFYGEETFPQSPRHCMAGDD